MTRPTRAQIQGALRTYIKDGDSWEREKHATAVFDKIEQWLKEVDNDLEAPALRKELTTALRAKVGLEAQLLELQARLDHATNDQAPIVLMPGAFATIEDRTQLDLGQLARGVPFILLDQPTPSPSPEPRVVPKIEVDKLVSDYHKKRAEPDPGDEA